MSTYYYIVCDEHKEITDAASETSGGWCPLGDAPLCLYGFIIVHSKCKSVRIIDEHQHEESSGGLEQECEGLGYIVEKPKWLYEGYKQWTEENAREMFDKERP